MDNSAQLLIFSLHGIQVHLEEASIASRGLGGVPCSWTPRSCTRESTMVFSRSAGSHCQPDLHPVARVGRPHPAAPDLVRDRTVREPLPLDPSAGAARSWRQALPSDLLAPGDPRAEEGHPDVGMRDARLLQLLFP
ncbi:unnamed protein product, partial [Prorocentrum cordatum]